MKNLVLDDYKLSAHVTERGSLKLRIERDGAWTEVYVAPDLVISSEEVRAEDDNAD